MHVDHAKARHAQQRVRQDAAVRRHDPQVWFQLGNLYKKCFVTKLRRLQDGDAGRGGEFLRGRRRDMVSASPGPIRLRDQPDDWMDGLNQRPQRRHGESGGPEIHNAQRSLVYHRPVRLSL